MTTLDELGDRVSAALRFRRVDVSDSPWSIADEVADDVVTSAVSRWGREPVIEALRSSRDDPYVAMMLVNISGASPILPPPPLQLGAVFLDDEIVEAAVRYLEQFPAASIRDGAWAWTALWNGWEQLREDDHARLVEELVDRAPSNDRVLRMIADGPLAVALTNEPFRERFDAARKEDPKIQRVWYLLQSA